MKRDKDENSDEGGSDVEEAENKPKRRHVECIMGNYTAEQLRNMHPQRTTHNFKVGNSDVIITSDFDAGNMARCEQMESGNHVSYILILTPIVQHMDVK